MPAKTICPITAADFANAAAPLAITINGQPFVAQVKEFSTGSFGWYLSGKTSTVVGGKAVQVQIGLNMTVVGSKDAGR